MPIVVCKEGGYTVRGLGAGAYARVDVAIVSISLFVPRHSTQCWSCLNESSRYVLYLLLGGGGAVGGLPPRAR